MANKAPDCVKTILPPVLKQRIVVFFGAWFAFAIYLPKKSTIRPIWVMIAQKQQ